MKRLAALALIPSCALARPFDRPIPMPQSATAEIWFALASAMLIMALYIVHRLVKSR